MKHKLLLAIACVPFWISCEKSESVEAIWQQARLGEKLLETHGCVLCHSTDGTTWENGGPSLQGILGQELETLMGDHLVRDAAYIEQSIRQPGAHIVPGYWVDMPEEFEDLSAEDIAAIITLIQVISEPH